ncbi:hypothetical protein JTB14_008797 [Gonioctena quinquepunctata]|nr:hypothetical protein JTB14_008797 [Gonioctena quinquepunctata]
MDKMESQAETEKVRPNIRIEIQNEKMDVDESENEEGEIVEDDVQDNAKKVASENIIQPVSRSIFTTGINIFDEEAQRKLKERARRFALKPEEIHTFTDADLEELYEAWA